MLDRVLQLVITVCGLDPTLDLHKHLPLLAFSESLLCYLQGYRVDLWGHLAHSYMNLTLTQQASLHFQDTYWQRSEGLPLAM